MGPLYLQTFIFFKKKKYRNTSRNFTVLQFLNGELKIKSTSFLFAICVKYKELKSQLELSKLALFLTTLPQNFGFRYVTEI